MQLEGSAKVTMHGAGKRGDWRRARTSEQRMVHVEYLMVTMGQTRGINENRQTGEGST